MSLLTGLLAGWRLNEEAGGPYSDVLGAYPMAAVGSPIVGAGPIGILNGMQLPTTSDFARMSACLITTAPYAVSAWFYADTANKTGFVFTQTRAATFDIQSIASVSSGKVSFGASGTTTTSGRSYTLNAWNHVVMAYDGVKQQGYINGVKDFNATGSAPIWPTTIPTTVLGANHTPAGLGNSYRIAQVYLWSRLLTDGGASVGDVVGGEIGKIYNGGAGVDYPWGSTDGKSP